MAGAIACFPRFLLGHQAISLVPTVSWTPVPALKCVDHRRHQQLQLFAVLFPGLLHHFHHNPRDQISSAPHPEDLNYQDYPNSPGGCL